MASTVVPFTPEVPEAALEDLHERLRRTRWPERETAGGWEQGAPLGVVRDLCAHWADGYDLRRVERRLAAAGEQLLVTVDGLAVHVLHARSPQAGALPLLMTHGWPGSVLEFAEIVGPLTDPAAHGGSAEDAFHVVCPSLPGYGFSGKPAAPGWGVERIAAAWDTLMAELGYDGRYAAHGGDWGAAVTMRLGAAHPARLAGIHLTMPVVSKEQIAACGPPTDAEAAALARFARHRREGTAYAQLQATRPQSLGYGLVDSPAAQCAWIAEKFHAWTDHRDRPFAEVVPRDVLLDHVTLYWLTASGASSARLYAESWAGGEASPVDVPTGCSVFPLELFPISRRWAEQRFRDLRHWTEFDRGGHFPAIERPDALVDELRACFRSVRGG